MKINRCRICKNKQLSKIGSLGKIAISNFTTTPQEGTKYPLELVYCRKCTLLQLAHNTPRELLYGEYWYQSHLNPVIVKDLKEIAQQGLAFIRLKKTLNNAWIDIGSNDGTLQKYLPNWFLKIGVDPSNIQNDLSDAVYRDYFENITAPKAGIITAIACLYDLPNPNKFMKNIKRHLTEDGVFICQLMTLEPMIENNDVGNICHEHIEFYSYKSLVKLFKQNGLEIFKVEKNKINGGSYRIFARHYKKGSIKLKEKEYGVKELKTFFKRIEKNKEDFKNAVSFDGSVYGYGASTKANTILQYYQVKELTIVDVNPNKKGKYTINTNCKIIDYVPKDAQYLWVFPYGFVEYFKKKEKQYKGKWITTIPKFKIL